ncbi:hypothetical protein TSOC_013561 [Tetrabaena socialis]|uniref:Uncharacterized protein n=1 Tax=Tetrabaena socialis TaxID=47790 RepID=A0A2J7ZK22_9CHLO|nr:hypothetical protein TSOC_013561 [Tetrabaena socialis]|eukprot:PNH00609.1 hypothetical protein TSOC_013561 [Tetrabaena socialis]
MKIFPKEFRSKADHNRCAINLSRLLRLLRSAVFKGDADCAAAQAALAGSEQRAQRRCRGFSAFVWITCEGGCQRAHSDTPLSRAHTWRYAEYLVGSATLTYSCMHADVGTVRLEVGAGSGYGMRPAAAGQEPTGDGWFIQHSARVQQRCVAVIVDMATGELEGQQPTLRHGSSSAKLAPAAAAGASLCDLSVQLRAALRKCPTRLNWGLAVQLAMRQSVLLGVATAFEQDWVRRQEVQLAAARAEMAARRQRCANGTGSAEDADSVRRQEEGREKATTEMAARRQREADGTGSAEDADSVRRQEEGREKATTEMAAWRQREADGTGSAEDADSVRRQEEGREKATTEMAARRQREADGTGSAEDADSVRRHREGAAAASAASHSKAGHIPRDPELPEGFKEDQPRGKWNGRFKWEATRMKTKLVNPPCLSKSFTFGSAPGDREAKLEEVKKWSDAGRPAGPWPKKELGGRR